MDPRRPVAPPGATLAQLRGNGPPGRYLSRGADHVLVVVAGRVEVAVGPAPPRCHGTGDAVVCPRGVPWSVRPAPGGARLVVVACPGGSEQAVGALLRDPGLDDAARVAVAADGGLELVLLPVPG